MEQNMCPFCKTQISTDIYFCPNCGKQIKDKPASTTVAKQIEIYLICIFLPPFGYIPAIKYLRQKEQKAKNIGIIALLITSISLILNLWIAVALITNLNNQINSQLMLINNSGF